MIHATGLVVIGLPLKVIGQPGTGGRGAGKRTGAAVRAGARSPWHVVAALTGAMLLASSPLLLP